MELHLDFLFPFQADFMNSFEKVDLLIIRRNEHLKWVPNLDLPLSIYYENEVLVLGKPGNRGKSSVGLVLFLKIPFSAHVPPKTSNLFYSNVFYTELRNGIEGPLMSRCWNVNFSLSKSLS